jgi:hypothetical protein
MKPRPPHRLRAGLRFVGVAALGILYGSAYGAVGVYISLFIDGLGIAEHWQTMALCIWIAIASVALTVWTIRVTGIGAAWFREGATFGSSRQKPDTFTREGATP